MKGLIFTWLLTAFGVSSSLFSPYYGFLAYVALALLKPDSLWASHISNGRFSLIVAMAMLGSWICRGFGNWNLGKARPVVLLFTGFWLWSALLACFAPSQTHAWGYVEQMAKILLPFLVGVTTCRTIGDLKALAWIIVLCEGYVCFEMNLYYFRGFNFLYFIGFAGMDNNSVSIGFVAALGVAFFLFLNSEPLWQKAILGACMAFILHAILFSFSRGAMLATGIGVTLSFFLIKKNSMHYSMFALGLAATLFLAGPEVRARFWKTFETKHGRFEESAQSRLELWADCWTVFQRSPIIGCGPDHWPLEAKKFGWDKVNEAHSLWIQTATETGIPGICMYAGFYLLCLWNCWKLLRRLPERAPPWFGDSCRMTIAALCGFGVAAQFVSLEALEVPYYVALVGAGSLVVYGRMEREGLIAADDEPVADWRDAVDDEQSRIPNGAAPPIDSGPMIGQPPLGILN
ncbi:MAG: O-antigen ligase family protein [Fuerstiella sp.]